MISKSELQVLFRKYLDNSINYEEYQMLLAHFSDPEQAELLDALILQQWNNKDFSSNHKELEPLVARVDEKIKLQISNAPEKIRLMPRIYPYVAAAALLLICFAAYFYFSLRTDTLEKTQVAAVEDVSAGGNRAILRLSGGREIQLDELQPQILSQKEGLSYGNGQTVFMPDNKLEIYSLETPRKGQYRAALPDGTQVWLNSESTIKFPSQFTGNSRIVRVEGEAYFEVVKDKHKKFIVELSDGSRIEVLGTHFNIQSYATSKEIKTSLLEGSVKFVTAKNQSVLLKPGEQARQHGTSGKIIVQEVNTSSVTAWKENKFNFEDIPFTEIMSQLERWYDIRVVYEGKVPKVEFYGELNRSNSLQYIMKAFADLGVKMELKDRTLIVY